MNEKVNGESRIRCLGSAPSSLGLGRGHMPESEQLGIEGTLLHMRNIAWPQKRDASQRVASAHKDSNRRGGTCTWVRTHSCVLCVTTVCAKTVGRFEPVSSVERTSSSTTHTTHTRTHTHQSIPRRLEIRDTKERYELKRFREVHGDGEVNGQAGACCVGVQTHRFERHAGEKFLNTFCSVPFTACKKGGNAFGVGLGGVTLGLLERSK